MSTRAATGYDVFISHASEDKGRFVGALDVALRERGVACWYDSREIQLGDDFRRRMDEGLAQARYGVVVLSPSFFKYWPEAELSALFNQEATFDQSRILPVRLDLDRATLTMRLPLLAARADIGWEQGVAAVADRIRDVVRATAASTRAVRSRAYNLPVRRAQTLVGREVDMERLLARLVPGRSVRVAASVEGLAGVGKTELALHLVDRLSETDRFPGGIFWFDAENPDLTAVWGGVIADSLAVGPGTLEERAAGAVRLVSSGAPVLLVLDNVERWTKASEPRPLPGGSHVSLLVTTRSRWLAGPSFDHYTLEVLGPEAARSLLALVSGRDLGCEPGAEELLAYVGGHALALELAGAYLREFPTVSPRTYLLDLTSGKHADDNVKDLVRYERTVHEALDVHQRHLDPDVRAALRVAACFAPEDASTALLEACGAGGDVQQPLRRFHLITGDGERWRMHRLVRAWAVESGTADQVEIAHRSFVEGCVAHAATIDLAEGFRVYQADGPHLLKATAEIASILGNQDERVSELLDRVGTALQSAGDLPRARALMEQALECALSGLGTDDPSVAMRRANLALVLRHLGERPRAKELLEQALASALKHLGEDHPSVATVRSNLGLVLHDLSDLPRAKELLEQALACASKHLGEDHPSVSTKRSNLALVLHALRDLPRAKDLLKQALATDLRNLGQDHPLVAIIRFNLARIYVDQGDLADARVLLQEALAGNERSLGPDHPSTAYTRVSLAEVLVELRDVESARREAERAVQAVLNQPAGSSYRSRVEQLAADVLDRVRARQNR